MIQAFSNSGLQLLRHRHANPIIQWVVQMFTGLCNCICQHEISVSIGTKQLVHKIPNQIKMVITPHLDKKLLHLSIGRSGWVYTINTYFKKYYFQKTLVLPLPPPYYSLYIISSSSSRLGRPLFQRHFCCGSIEIHENSHSLFSTIPFCTGKSCAQVHLTVHIACLRRDSQPASVNFCAQAADLVSTKFPI